jgi:hypothetical protein
MSREISKEEFESTIQLRGSDRYIHFIKQVANSAEIWMLGNESGIASYNDDEGNILIPIWPHEVYAKACCTDEFSNYTPESISLEDWIEDWLPEMHEEGQLIAVFPVPNDKGTIIEWEVFIEDIEEELDKY